MIEAQAVQNGGVEIVDVASVLHDVGAQVVRLSVNRAAFDTAARQPRRVGLVEMASADGALRARRTPEFRGENYQRIFEQSPRFQIGQQARDRLVDFAG